MCYCKGSRLAAARHLGRTADGFLFSRVQYSTRVVYFQFKGCVFQTCPNTLQNCSTV